jgi:hypothetical protein
MTTNILPTSTCSILKQFGAPTQMHNIPEMLVFMLIIGKISEENLTFSNMKENNVHNGKPSILCKHMLMAVKMSIGASSLTAGRNKSIILSIIRSMHAGRALIVRSLIVHIFTVMLIKDSLSGNNLGYSQETVGALLVEAIMHSTNCIKQYFCSFCSTKD